MRRSGASSGGRDEFPQFPIGPVLVHYGGDDVAEGFGPRAYKCPFHGDRSASATVSEIDGWFNCHAADCPKGNAVQIIMKQEGLPYREAVERAQAISGTQHVAVRGTSGRSGRLAGGSRNRDGSRAFKRTWRSD